MKVRCFAFAFALLIAATPAMAMVCEIDCDAITAPPCHHAGVAGDRSMMRSSGTHACDHEHRGMSPTLLANASLRDFVAMSATALPAIFLDTLVVDLSSTARMPIHGPPGSTPRSAASDTTVLRI